MSNIKKFPSVLTIAGSDSSGGAGIQADIKTIAATGCYAASVITALTSQNTLGVQAVYAIPAAVVAQQIESVLSDLNIDAIKIGMLVNEEIMVAVVAALKKFKIKNVVLDPVMISKGGSELLQADAVAYLKNNLFRLSSLITPNINEAEKIIGNSIKNRQDMKLAATTLGKKYQSNILIKGGHLNTNDCADVLYFSDSRTCHWYVSPRINTQNTHGTGCTLSAAIASYLAQDYSMLEAVAAAKQYLTKAIQAGSLLNIGHGIGPVDHFHTQEKTLYAI